MDEWDGWIDMDDDEWMLWTCMDGWKNASLVWPMKDILANKLSLEIMCIIVCISLHSTVVIPYNCGNSDYLSLLMCMFTSGYFESNLSTDSVYIYFVTSNGFYEPVLFDFVVVVVFNCIGFWIVVQAQWHSTSYWVVLRIETIAQIVSCSQCSSLMT